MSSPPNSPPSNPIQANLTDRLFSSIFSAAAIPSGPHSGSGPSSPQSVKDSKEKLSIQATTTNFRKFVRKSGPLFWFQDQIESIILWDDPFKTLFWALVWVLLVLCPQLTIFIPNAIILYTIIYSYMEKHDPAYDITELEFSKDAKSLDLSEPSEGSADYFTNLQNIQITMGRLADFTDMFRKIIPYLNWTHPRITLAILNATLIVSTLTYLSIPWLPWRLLVASSLPLTLLATCPIVTKLCLPIIRSLQTETVSHPTSTTTLDDPFVEATSSNSSTAGLGTFGLIYVNTIILWARRLNQLVQEFVTQDSLSDSVLDKISKGDYKDVVVFETERRMPSTTSSSSSSDRPLELLGWSSDALLARDPPAWLVVGNEKASSEATKGLDRIAPQGMQWVPGEEWQVDKLGDWFDHSDVYILDQHIDKDGWVYLDDSCAELPDTPQHAQIRRRKWSRRAIPIS